MQASPAGALSASGLDMGSFMLAHLQDGEYNGARILKTETAQLMHTQSNTFDAALPGMAHGFMEAQINGRRLIGHGGDLPPAFYTLLACYLRNRPVSTSATTATPDRRRVRHS